MDSATLVDVLVVIVQLTCAGLLGWGAWLALGFGGRAEESAVAEPERLVRPRRVLNAAGPPGTPA